MSDLLLIIVHYTRVIATFFKEKNVYDNIIFLSYIAFLRISTLSKIRERSAVEVYVLGFEFQVGIQFVKKQLEVKNFKYKHVENLILEYEFPN